MNEPLDKDGGAGGCGTMLAIGGVVLLLLLGVCAL